jgi:CRP/FNR family transcriptional regulator, cyclic AMP receptor protein
MQTINSVEELVESHPFLSDLAPRYFHFLGENASLREIEAGHQVFHEGGEAECFYLIVRGKIELTTFVPGSGVALIQSLEGGEALGWSWLFPPYEWHFTATAVAPTELIVFDAAKLREKIKQDTKFSNELVTRVAQTLVQRLQGTRAQLVDLYGIRP